MASSAIEDRLKKIDGLKCFIKSVEDRVKEITNELDWNFEELTQNETSLSTCSVHPEHRVRKSRLNEHEEKCQWLKDGYCADDVAFPEFHGQGSYIVFTPELQEEVIKNCPSGSCNIIGETSGAGSSQRGIPQTSSRFDKDFTREEKLALYNYVVANTEKQKIYKDLTLFHGAGKEQKTEEKLMTPLELAAAERDAKRRRASYRNKVHTNRKTQTEILREVIDSQMEALTEEISSEKNYKGKYSRNDAEYSSGTDHPKKPHKPDRSHKSWEYRDHRKRYSDREIKHKDKYSREERSKSKKRKRSRSRSRSRDRFKYRKSHTRSNHSSYTRY